MPSLLGYIYYYYYYCCCYGKGEWRRMAIYLSSIAIWLGDCITSAPLKAVVESRRDEGSLFDNKPAMLVVTDEAGRTLMYSAGYSRVNWLKLPQDALIKGESYSRSLYYRSGADIVSYTTAYPTVAALSFYPDADFPLEIVRSGKAAQGFLVIDSSSTYPRDQAQVPTHSPTWPSAYWSSSEDSIPDYLENELVRYIPLSVGDLESDATLKLSDTDLDATDGLVSMIGTKLDIHLPNLLRDTSQDLADFDELLAGIPHIGRSEEDVLAKEAAVAGD